MSPRLIVGWCWLLLLFGSGPLRAASDAEYAAVTTGIVARIGALTVPVRGQPWAEAVKRAVVQPDGSGGLVLEHGATWSLDDPTQLESKLNGRRLTLAPGGYSIRLTFSRGRWPSAAVLTSAVFFDDLILRFEADHNGAPEVVAAVAQAIGEAKRDYREPAAMNKP